MRLKDGREKLILWSDGTAQYLPPQGMPIRGPTSAAQQIRTAGYSLIG
jgi:hypothetical protein